MPHIRNPLTSSQKTGPTQSWLPEILACPLAPPGSRLARVRRYLDCDDTHHATLYMLNLMRPANYGRIAHMLWNISRATRPAASRSPRSLTFGLWKRV